MENTESTYDLLGINALLISSSFSALLKSFSLVDILTSFLQPNILLKSMLLSLEENEPGWATSVTEFKKDISSRANERFKEEFSEVSHEELTFSEIEFLTFLSLAVTVDVEGKYRLIDLTLHSDFLQGWNCSLDCFEGTLETKNPILGNSILIIFAVGLELVFTLLLLHFSNGTKWFVWNFSNFLKLLNVLHLHNS